MDANEVVSLLKKLVSDQKAKGDSTLSIAGMEAALVELEKVVAHSDESKPTGTELERYKAILSGHLDHENRLHELRLEMLRAVIATGQMALKTSLLINGGATAALLAFIGKATDKIGGSGSVLWISVTFFAVGVLTAGVATGATYFSQAGYGNEFGKFSRRIGVTGHFTAILCVIGSYVLFGLGTWQAAHALRLGS